MSVPGNVCVWLQRSTSMMVFYKRTSFFFLRCNSDVHLCKNMFFPLSKNFLPPGFHSPPLCGPLSALKVNVLGPQEQKHLSLQGQLSELAACNFAVTPKLHFSFWAQSTSVQNRTSRELSEKAAAPNTLQICTRSLPWRGDVQPGSVRGFFLLKTEFFLPTVTSTCSFQCIMVESLSYKIKARSDRCSDLTLYK